MQVAELIQHLRKAPQEAEVEFTVGPVLAMSEVEREKVVIQVPARPAQAPAG